MRALQDCFVSGLALLCIYSCSSGSETSESSGAGGSGGAGASDAGGGVMVGGSGGATAGAGGNAGTAGGGGTAGSAQGGSGGSSGGSGTGGSQVRDAGELPDVVFEYDAGDADQPDACVSTTITADPIPLDLVILLDRSGSMCEGGPYDANDQRADCNIDDEPMVDSKWCRAINALMDFFEMSSSVGMGVGFRSFAESNVPSYNCVAYSSLDVDFGIIAGGTSDQLLMDLETAMNDAEPRQGTPTERALETIVEFTAARQQANQDSGDANRKVIGIIVTDGEPQTCNRDTDDLNQIVVDHYDATGIPTFFIGMDGAEFRGLEEMANGAGADVHSEYCMDTDPYNHAECHYYNVGNGDGTVLSDVLEAIRTSVIGCQFAVPPAEAGLVDLETIEVVFTPSAGGPETLTRVLGGEAACDGNEGYYTDDDVAPTTILLCPATCTRAEADPGSSVSIELLCEGS